MTDEPTTALSQLFATVDRLKVLTDGQGWGLIGKARRMPADARAAVAAVRISAQGTSEPYVEAALEIQRRLADEKEAEGHEQRRAALDAIAAEIDKLRPMLPDLIVDAVVELGVRARQLREEASQ